MSTSNNSFGVIFYLKKNKANKDGLCPIAARITVNGKRLEVSVKRSASPNNWNAARGIVKGTREEAVKLNKYLDRFKATIIADYQDMFMQKKLVTAELLKGKVTGTEQSEFTLGRLMEYHNSKQKEVLEWGTMKNYGTTQKYLQRFLIERFSTTDKYLSELSYKFITDFEYFLRNIKNKQGEPAMSNNGVMKHLERFRKMINLALRLEWMERNPFSAHQLKFDKVERDFLTKEELSRIELKKLTIVRLQMVRDLFVFSCYTGLAYIDVTNLTPVNKIKGIDGEYWIVTNRQKTNVPVRVPLLPKALEIVNKYEGHPKAVADGRLLPSFSNQKLNSYLKEIADLCDITKPLTFHIARHTFATTVTLSNGVPIETVSKLLGHAKLTTTQIYAKVIESKVSDDMRMLRGKLDAKNNSEIKHYKGA